MWRRIQTTAEHVKLKILGVTRVTNNRVSCLPTIYREIDKKRFKKNRLPVFDS